MKMLTGLTFTTPPKSHITKTSIALLLTSTVSLTFKYTFILNLTLTFILESAKDGRDPNQIQKALDRTRRIGRLPDQRQARPKFNYGFFARIWAYGPQFATTHYQSGEKYSNRSQKS